MPDGHFTEIKIGKFTFTGEKPSIEFVDPGGYTSDREEIYARNSKARTEFIEYVRQMVDSALEQEVSK